MITGFGLDRARDEELIRITGNVDRHNKLSSASDILGATVSLARFMETLGTFICFIILFMQNTTVVRGGSRGSDEHPPPLENK